ADTTGQAVVAGLGQQLPAVDQRRQPVPVLLKERSERSDARENFRPGRRPSGRRADGRDLPSATVHGPGELVPPLADPRADERRPTSDCGFHQWAYQTFLWETQTVDGDLRFITQTYTPAQVFSTSGPLPALSRVPKNKKLTLRPRDSKSTAPRSLGSINQAGDSGVLVDPNSKRAVYYAVHLNDVYYSFIRSNNYNTPQTLLNAPATQNYPVGTLELKSSWRIVGPNDDTSGFYTTTADIELLTT